MNLIDVLPRARSCYRYHVYPSPCLVDSGCTMNTQSLLVSPCYIVLGFECSCMYRNIQLAHMRLHIWVTRRFLAKSKSTEMSVNRSFTTCLINLDCVHSGSSVLLAILCARGSSVISDSYPSLTCQPLVRLLPHPTH